MAKRTVLLILLGSLWLPSCATYSRKISEARILFQHREYDAAIEKLKPLAEKKDGDYLLYLLDLGTVYHNAGRYQEAINTFLAAEKEAEIKDYTSLSEEAGSVFLNDNVKTYKGEHFENVLINVYLAIDFTMLGKWESALVECRKVNHKLGRMISEGKLPYDHNSFAKYLAAALFEAQGEYNDAFVDYRQLTKWAGEYPYLPVPLLRMADRLRSSQELDEYKTKYKNVKSWRLGKETGEVILLVEQGLAPYKIPNPQWRRIPKFQRSIYQSDAVVLRDKSGSVKAVSAPLFDIEETAIKELEARTGGLIAKKIAGVVVKEAAAYGVAKATDSKALGALTSILLHATDQADTRSWLTLPARLHVARLMLPAGRHDLVVDMVAYGGKETPGMKVFEGVDIKGGKITFLHYRTPDT